MPLQLHWVDTPPDNQTVTIKSPVTGQLQPVLGHPDPLYNSGIMSQAASVELQQGTVRAPFSGHYSYDLSVGRRLRFKHTSGLILQLELPLWIADLYSTGIAYLATSGTSVTQGQAVLQLDLQRLRQQHEVICAIFLNNHPAIKQLYAQSRWLQAVKDTLFWVTLDSQAAKTS